MLAAFAARRDVWLVALLALAAIGSRLFTNPLYAGEPTSDEYVYGLYALEVARSLLGLSAFELPDLSSEGRLAGLIVGTAVTLVPLDPITLGRFLQALFNALAVPLVYGLGRAIGLRWQASLAGAVLLLVMPEPWETAWRFWLDSQATLLSLAAVLVLLRLVQRPGVGKGVLAAVLLAGTFLTKEYIGAATFPAIAVGGALAAISPLLQRDGRRFGVAAAGLAFVAVPALLALVALFASSWVRSLLEPTFLAGSASRVLSALETMSALGPAVVGRLPEYLVGLDRQFGPTEFGAGLVVFWAIGGLALVLVAARATIRPGPDEGVAQGRAAPAMPTLLWTLALLAWASVVAFGWLMARELVAEGLFGIALLGLATGLVGVGALRAARPASAVDEGVEQPRTPLPRLPLGLVVLGVYVMTFVAFRFLIWAADLGAAFTPRAYQPLFPVLALLAGCGLVATTHALAWLLATVSRAGPRVAQGVVFAALLIGTVWFLTPANQYLGSSSLLGYRADREGDLETPGGMRITALVGSERWLEANVSPGDRILTSIPRQLAWYGRTGVEGYLNAVTIGDLAPTLPERRESMMAWLAHPSVIDYVIDFNLHWTQPDSEESQAWYAHYRWLQTRPYLEEVYVRKDPNGRVVLYAFRNHRWAMSPSYVDREEARARQLGAGAG